MRENRRSWLSPEMITALAAVVIGVGAIGVSLYETTLVRQQLKGSVWPNVESGYTFTEDRFTYFVVNSGVGPARMRYAEITVDGQPVQDWGEFFDRLGLEVGRYETSYVARGALPPGTRHEVMAIDAAQPVDALARAQHRVGITVCYCSVYDDCWTKHMGEDPEPVRECVLAGNRRFAN